MPNDLSSRLAKIVEALPLRPGLRVLESGASKPAGSILADYRAIRPALMCDRMGSNPISHDAPNALISAILSEELQCST
jgi:hypothetical protein